MSSDENARPRRTIRSFVQRAGRITRAQQRALEELWPRYGIDAGDSLLDFAAIFGRRAPLVMEIGMGDGETLLELADQDPGTDFVGIEVHRPGLGHCLLGLEARGLANARLVTQDAVEVLQWRVPNAAIDELLLYFPDPWPKKRHHKRRIVQPSFVELIARRLKPGGVFRIATDWAPYAQHMLEVLAGCTLFTPAAEAGPRVARPVARPVTKFEQRGERLGHEVFDLEYRTRRGAVVTGSEGSDP
jgi:tRNA (guanine-N7-)-methyltransferase